MAGKNPELYRRLQLTIASFLGKVGYQTLLDKRFLFSNIGVWGRRNRHQIVCQPAIDVEEAVDRCRDLCTAKCKLGDEADYALVFPPIKEHHFIEFLTEMGRRPYYLDIRSQYFMIWVANPDVGSVEVMIGGSQDKELEKAVNKLNKALKGYFLGGFVQYINRIIDEKMRKEEI